MSLIYHYTSSQGLLGILQYQFLRLTHVKFLNDSRELYHGVNVITESLTNELVKLKNLEEPSILNNNPLLGFAGLGIKPEKISSFVYPENIQQADNAIDCLLGHINYYSEISPFYTTSFCLQGDKLRQWSAYCPEGGYSIGFDKSIMDNSNIETNKEHPELNLTVNAIDYSKTTSLETLLKDFILEVKNLTTIHKQIEDEDKFRDEFSNWFTRLKGLAYKYTHLALQHKECNFKDEEEVRTTLSFENHLHINKIDNFQTEFFTKGCLVIPFKKLYFQKEAIKEIIVGPMQHQELACISLMELRHKFGLKFKIIKSNIPLRTFQ